MNFVTSTLKVVLGLAVFASLMSLEFASYTRAVAEEVHPSVLESQKTSTNNEVGPVKKDGKALR